MSIINNSFMPLKAFLGNSNYHIPNYQRVYSWEESELEDMWLDVLQVVNDQNESHFFGQIVVHNNKTEKIKYIIDGQQRTTTAVIFYAAIRDLQRELFKDSGDQLTDARIDAEEIATTIIGWYTETRDDRHLIQGELDKEFFGNYIQKETKFEVIKTSLTKPQKRIVFAYEYLKEKISNELSFYENSRDKYEKLHKISESLGKNSNVMYIETDEMNEAFIIFETLNARGRDLETSDLLKNHLFRVSNKKIEEMKTKWNQMVDILGKVDTTKYIRFYWNSHKYFIREKELYKTIRKQVNTPLDASKLMDDLLTLAEPFSALENPLEDNYYSAEIKQILINIKIMGAKSYYPIILSMQNKNYSFNDIEQVLKKIEVLVVRNFVTSGLVANKYETEFAKLAYNIYKEEIDSVEDILIELKKMTVKDADFQYNFARMEIKNKATIRYILRKINDISYKELRTINDNTKIHIEHIMPVKANEWDITPEIHDNYLWRLGNLTLLGEEYNRKITNKLFVDKKTQYLESQIKITNDLALYKTWDSKSIEERQENLAKEAITIWEL